MKRLLIFLSLAMCLSGCGSPVFRNSENQIPCRNAEHAIAIILQSGEKGILYITDMHCDIPSLKNRTDIVFDVSADGVLKENMYDSKLFVWLRNPNLSVEAQLMEKLEEKFKDKDCKIEQNPYSYNRNLETYRSNCFAFGAAGEYASELYAAPHNVLIAYRQDGADGIPPFDLSSVRFVKD